MAALPVDAAGSDVQAIRTVARRDGDVYRLTGTKFVTNGREGNTFALLALTDPRAEPPLNQGLKLEGTELQGGVLDLLVSEF